MNLDRRNETSFTLLRVVGILYSLNRQTRSYGTDTNLHDSEIHMIKMIKEHPDCHVTALAGLLEVTKGAVSQIIQRLYRKKMVEKGRDAQNLTRLSLHLTDKGEAAYRAHEELHARLNEMVQTAQASFSEDERKSINTFLHLLEAELSKFSEG